MTRTHFAFQARDGALVGGDDSYAVDVHGATFAVQPVGTTKPLELTTTAFGGELAGDRAFTRQPDGHVASTLGNGIVEHLRNGHTGVEQSWELDHAPAGNDDVVVRVAVAGEQFTQHTGAGLHFTDPATGLGTIYSDARWVDADGTTTAVRAELEDGAIVMRVPRSVVSSSAYPAVLDPTIGSEFPVGPDPLDSAPNDQLKPAIGHSGELNNEFLVVWEDRRRQIGANNHDLYAAHVDRNGNVLDSTGFIISAPNDGNDHASPSISYDAATHLYLITYIQQTLGFDNSAVVARAITTSGTVPLPPTYTIAGPTTGTTFSNVDLAWDLYVDNTSHFGIVWQEDIAGTSHVHAATGVLTITGSSASFSMPYSAEIFAGGKYPRIANSTGDFFGSKFLVVFQYMSHVGGQTIDENFVVSPGFIIQQATMPTEMFSAPSVGYFGGQNGSWLVGSTHSMMNGGSYYYEIVATEVASIGAIVHDTITLAHVPSTEQLFGASVAGYGISPTTGGPQAFVGWGHMKVYLNYGELEAARVELDGTHHMTIPGNYVMPTGDLNMTDGFPNRYIAAHSDEIGHYTAVWAPVFDLVHEYRDIRGAHFGFDGSIDASHGVGFLISSGYPNQSSPAIARCADRYLVAWPESGGPGAYIVGAIFDIAGTNLASNIPIATRNDLGDTHVAVGCNGKSFSVAWEDRVKGGNSNIYTTLVTADGKPRDPGGVLVKSSGDNFHPSLTSNDAATWIVWDQHDQVKGSSTIYAQQLDGANHPMGTLTVIDIQAKAALAMPDIDTLDGKSFYVVYQQDTDLYARSLASTGAVGPKLTIEAQSAARRNPRIRWDGKAYLIVYEDDRNVSLGLGTDIYARRLSSAGSLDAAFAIASTPDNDLLPRLARRDQTNITMEVTYARRATSAAVTTDVYGQTVVSGAVSGASYPISTSKTSDETAPDVACVKPSSCLSVYQGFDFVSTNAYRVMARVLGYP